jgi:hypothetical protein
MEYKDYYISYQHNVIAHLQNQLNLRMESTTVSSASFSSSSNQGLLGKVRTLSNDQTAKLLKKSKLNLDNNE